MTTAPHSAIAKPGLFQTHAKRLPRLRMKALMRENNQVSVQLVSRPELADAASVVVRVTVAGLCRTDLYAADGKIKVVDPVVLGHEFAGVIDEVGAEVQNLKVGQRVTVNPTLPCLNCKYCQANDSKNCQSSTFLGVDRCGCFAEFICVPSSAILPIPDSISDLAAAYTEPVAASLAVLKAGIGANDKGLIYGNNRFSQLMEQILRAHSINNVTVYDTTQDRGSLVEGAFDYVIETALTAESLVDMTHAVRPGGKLILKSRQYDPVELNMTSLLKKEPIMHVVNYGTFEDAIELLASGKISIDELVDGVYPLEDFKRVFAGARNKESLKPFFSTGEGY